MTRPALDGEKTMRTMCMRLYTQGLLGAMVALAFQLTDGVAQDVPPAPAPVAPQQAVRGEEAAAAAPERNRNARIEALRQRWAELTASPPRAGSIQMVVQGDYIYILYGTYLCQLSAETLELKAKVDLRELVFGDRREARERLRLEGQDRKPKPVAEAPAEEGAQPAGR